MTPCENTRFCLSEYLWTGCWPMLPVASEYQIGECIHYLVGLFVCQFYKGANLCSFLFASLGDEAFPK